MYPCGTLPAIPKPPIGIELPTQSIERPAFFFFPFFHGEAMSIRGLIEHVLDEVAIDGSDGTFFFLPPPSSFLRVCFLPCASNVAPGWGFRRGMHLKNGGGYELQPSLV